MRLVLILAVVLGSTPAFADAQAEARSRAHFETARGFFDVGEYEEALKEFVAGYDASPHREFLLNMGRCYRQLKQPEKARDLYRRFLEQAPPHDPNRAATQAQMEQLDREILEATPPPPKAQPSLVPESAAAATAEHMAEPERSPRRKWIWPVVAVGAALVVGAIVLGVVAASGTDFSSNAQRSCTGGCLFIDGSMAR